MPNSRAWLLLEEFHKCLIGIAEFWASARKVLQADFRPIFWLISEIWANTNVAFWQGCVFRRGSLRWVLTQSCGWGTQAQRREKIYVALMTAWLQSPGSWPLCCPPTPSRDSWHPVGKEWFHLAWALRPTSPWGHGDPLGTTWFKNLILCVQLGHWLWKGNNFYLYPSSEMWVHSHEKRFRWLEVKRKTPNGSLPTSTPSLLTRAYTVNSLVHIFVWSSLGTFT